ERREDQLIGIFLPPGDAALVAEYPQLQAVFAAGCDLACPDAAPGTPPEAQHQLRAVVELSSGDERREFGTQGFDLEPGDEADQVIDVSADVADAPTGARFGGIRAPLRLLIAARLDVPAKPVLRIFTLHDADCAEISAGYHFL